MVGANTENMYLLFLKFFFFFFFLVFYTHVTYMCVILGRVCICIQIYMSNRYDPLVGIAIHLVEQVVALFR